MLGRTMIVLTSKPLSVTGRTYIQALRRLPEVYRVQRQARFALNYEGDASHALGPLGVQQRDWNSDTLDGRRGEKNQTWKRLMLAEVEYVYVEVAWLGIWSAVVCFVMGGRVYPAHRMILKKDPMIPLGVVVQKLTGGARVLYVISSDKPIVGEGLVHKYVYKLVMAPRARK